MSRATAIARGLTVGYGFQAVVALTALLLLARWLVAGQFFEYVAAYPAVGMGTAIGQSVSQSVMPMATIGVVMRMQGVRPAGSAPHPPGGRA